MNDIERAWLEYLDRRAVLADHRDAFLAGVKWARGKVHPDTLCPHGYRLENLRDGTDTCEGCE